MRSIRILSSIAGIALLVAGCARTGMNDFGKEEVFPANPSNVNEGVVHIKLSKSPDGIESVRELLSPLGEDISVERMFSHAGKYEERHIKYGLDRWYSVHFDTNTPVTRAHNAISGLEGVDLVEFDYKVEFNGFNDPKLSAQWHYDNDGSLTGSQAGSDINLEAAWAVETGSSEVVVAICDGGVQYDHPDLAANMWVNQAEYSGAAGADDDGNGYVDDIYGFNFVAEEAGGRVGTITPHDHGTHVAGTVAAVNNNGVGVAGIAGGDGSAGSGVRLMSIQTIDGTNRGAYISEGIAYAADNGATLMNCSWHIEGATETPDYLTLAINYFNEVAGCDENGMQVGPMKGGLVIFAAGNESTTYTYPGMDDNVLAVASIGADFVRAYYSNYGEWVDLTAPGGDAQKGSQVASTLPGGEYGYMQGTSMAAPHATGVAALALSKFKGQGFDREKLIHILKNATNPVIYEYNQGFVGMLGFGLVDAYKAASLDGQRAAKVTQTSFSTNVDNVTLKWIVPGDADDASVYKYSIYCSEQSLAGLDPKNPGAGVDVRRLSGVDYRPGTEMSYEFKGLKLDCKYYFCIATQGLDESHYELSDEISVTTSLNHAPEVEVLTETELSLKSHETAEIKFKVSEVDDQELEYSIVPSAEGISLSVEGDVVSVLVDALKFDEDSSNEFVFKVSDPYVSVEEAFSIEVLKNNAPENIADIDDIVFNALSEKRSIDLSKVFADADGEHLSYSYTLSPSTTIARGSFAGDTFELSSYSYGTCKLTVTAKDARGKTASCSFDLLIRDGSNEFDFYPNPIVDKLNIRSGEDKTLSITISNKAGAVVYSADNAQIGPFNVCTVDMSEQAAGVYYISVKGEGYDNVYSVIKK